VITTIDIPFDFGQIVYLKTDIDQNPYMVHGIRLCADGGILIGLIQGTKSSEHYIIEISPEKDTVLRTV